MIVLAGPTASGKSELAAALAERLGGEVIGADSRQVYRFLDAGTAKPTPEQRARAPHRLLDAADPAERYDAARFAREASAAIADARARGKAAVVCGGTGLYLRALLEGLSPLPGADPALRARLQDEAARLGRERLHARLAAADPPAAAAIPPANLQRVVRALEVLELTGRPISQHWRRGREGGLKADAVLRLELPASELRARVEARARAMWPAMLEEVRALVPARFSGSEPAFSSLGYPQALACAAGRLSPEEGLAELIRATLAYAKRQRTWFSRQLAAVPIPAEGTPAQTLTRALAALNMDSTN